MTFFKSMFWGMFINALAIIYAGDIFFWDGDKTLLQICGNIFVFTTWMHFLFIAIAIFFNHAEMLTTYNDWHKLNDNFAKFASYGLRVILCASAGFYILAALWSFTGWMDFYKQKGIEDAATTGN